MSSNTSYNGNGAPPTTKHLPITSYLEDLKQLLLAYSREKQLSNLGTLTTKHIGTELAPNLKRLAQQHDVKFATSHLEAALAAVSAELIEAELVRLRERLRYMAKVPVWLKVEGRLADNPNNGAISAQDGSGEAIAGPPSSLPATPQQAAAAGLTGARAEQATPETPIYAFLRCLLYRPPTPDEIAVFSHFLWLCKRHLFGLPARYHMMPVIVGPQGSGKTETLKRLLTAGFGDLVLITSFDYMEDERNTPALAKHYIVFLDEMARANRADVSNLKRLLTQEKLTYRPLHTNDDATVKNNVTLIGASNMSTDALIKDETGMRRFYELKVDTVACNKMSTEERVMHWEQLDRIDYLEVWRSVNEQLSVLPEFIALRDTITKTQVEELQTTDMLGEFLSHNGYMPGIEGVDYSGTKAPNKRFILDLLLEYREFLQSMGSYFDSGIDPRAFRKKLKERGFEVQRSSHKYFVLLASSSVRLVGSKQLLDTETNDNSNKEK